MMMMMMMLMMQVRRRVLAVRGPHPGGRAQQLRDHPALLRARGVLGETRQLLRHLLPEGEDGHLHHGGEVLDLAEGLPDEPPQPHHRSAVRLPLLRY